MGNDGGSIPKKSDIIKVKKVIKVFNRNIEKTISCDLSKESLSYPIVIDRVGYIYNKEQILKRILEKTIPADFNHIKSLKNIKNVSDNSILKEDNNLFVCCALTKVKYIGNKGLFFLFKCGCIINQLFDYTDKSLKERDKLMCPNCNIENSNHDIIELSLNNEEMKSIRNSLLKISKNKEIKSNNMLNKKRIK